MLYREIIAVCSEIHTKHINRHFCAVVPLNTYKERNTENIPVRPIASSPKLPNSCRLNLAVNLGIEVVLAILFEFC